MENLKENLKTLSVFLGNNAFANRFTKLLGKVVEGGGVTEEGIHIIEVIEKEDTLTEREKLFFAAKITTLPPSIAMLARAGFIDLITEGLDQVQREHGITNDDNSAKTPDESFEQDITLP